MTATHVKRFVRTAMLATVAASTLLVMTAGAAFAAYPSGSSSSSDDSPADPDDMSLSFSPANPGPGDNVNGTINGGTPWTDLHVLVELNPVLFDDTVRTNVNGDAFFSFQIPADAPDNFTINVTVSGAGVDGVLSGSLNGDQTATPLSGLAFSGSNTGTLVMTGLVIAALGVFALVMGRRREHSRSAGTEVRVDA